MYKEEFAHYHENINALFRGRSEMQSHQRIASFHDYVFIDERNNHTSITAVARGKARDFRGGDRVGSGSVP